jgi:hypothetical protein
MKVLMLRSLSGYNETYRKGEVYDLPDSKALLLLRQGNASPVKQEREKSVITPIEKAITDVQVNNSTDKRADKSGGSKIASKGNVKRGRKSNN